MIGAGAVAIKNTEEVGTYIGVPAKVMNKSNVFGGIMLHPYNIYFQALRNSSDFSL